MDVATASPASQPRRRVIVRDAKTGRVTAFVPTEEQRRMVKKLSGIGCTDDEILFCVPWGREDDRPITLKTLYKNFGAELKAGRSIAHMQIKAKLFDIAAGGNLAAIMFYLRTRCGWKETVNVQTLDENGKPTAPVASAAVLYLPQKDEVPQADMRTVIDMGPAQPAD